MRRWLPVAALSLLAVTSCKHKTPPPVGAPPPPLPPIDLKPLPEPPAIKVEAEAIPGSGEEVAVVAARPKGDVDNPDHPTITFNQPMVAIGTVDEQKSLPAPARIEPALPGEWRWLGSASVELVPSGLVPYATEFTVTVPAGLASVSGRKLASDYVYKFATARPKLQDLQPAAGEADYDESSETRATWTYDWLTPDQTFTLLFNQPVADLPAHLKLSVGGVDWGVQVAKEVSVADETREQEAKELAAKGEGRRYDRDSHEAHGFKNQQTRYEVTPAKPLPLGSAVTLSLDTGLRGKQGPLTLSEQVQRNFHTYGPMKLEEVTACAGTDGRCSYGPVVIFTSNQVDVKTLKDHVTIRPQVDIDWDRVEASMPEGWTHRNLPFFSLPGKFRPGTKYEVAFQDGIKDVFGQSMTAAKGSAHTDDLEPYFNAGSDEALIELIGDGALPIQSANLESVDAELAKMTPGEMATWVATERQDRMADLPSSTAHTVKLESKRNLVHTQPLPLREWLGGSGLFALRLAGATTTSPQIVWGQVTDLAVHSKLGATSGLIWVTRLSNGSSVGGAEVTLWSQTGQKLWSGTTGPDGLAKTPGLSSFTTPDEEREATYRTPFALVSATAGEDTGVTLSTWTGGYSAWSYHVEEDWDGKIPKARGLIFAERGIYRPGDTVYLKGVLRYRQLGKLATLPKGATVEVTVQSSREQEISKKTLPLSAFGTFDEKVVIPADAPLGEFSIDAVADHDAGELSYHGSFRVEEYRPPQFMVDVTSSKSDWIAGDSLDATVLARYLFGGAMADADVSWSVNRATTPFTPPGNEGFSFGVNVWGWDDSEARDSSDVFASGTGKTDQLGVLQLTPGKAESPTGRTYTYTIEANVADVSRQQIANRVALTVHPAAVYAGLRNRATGWFGETGKASTFEVIAVDPKGERQEGIPIDVKIQRRDWKSIRKEGVGDRWTYIDEKTDVDVASCAVKSTKVPQTCEFTPKDPGLYVLSATATDAAGRKSLTSDELYVIGNGWVSWQRNEGDKLDLVADKNLYDIGDTAKILVKSPYPEADAVVTVEREGVLTAKRVHLKGAATALEVPIDESLVPNAYVGVVLVRGRVAARDGDEPGDDPGRPAVRVGYTQINVEKRSKRLTVTLTPDRREKRPRDKVQLDVAVTDWKGAGTRAEVTVWAVDEGVLRLTDYKTPDPIDAVHPKLGLSVRIGEPLLHLVARKQYGDKGTTVGGSGGDDSTGADVRRAFKTTAIFAPTVLTDAAGKAHVEFSLPDNLTTFRIMAVAVTREDRFGEGESAVQVAKPLLALPALPRFARVGDHFEAGVVVHAPGAKVKDVKVSAKIDGLTLDGPPEETASLADGKPKEVRFHFTAEKPGTATFTFRVEGGGESDAVEQKIPVELPVGLEAVALYGDTRDDRKEAVVPPKGVRPDIGGLDVTLASTIMGGFSENFRQLVDYPYGCLEQLTSRLIPFVELRKLQSKFNVAWKGPTRDKKAATEREDFFIHRWLGGDTLGIYGTDDPDVVIKKTLAAIEKLQNHDGGFRYWQDSSCSDDWSSAYAVLVLKRAKDVGYPVDSGVLRRGQEYLERVAAGVCTQCWFCIKPDDTTRVNALYTLARTGKPKASYYGELFERRAKLPLFAQAMLDDAMYVGGGDRGQARTLFQEILNHARETPKDVHFEETDRLTYAARWASDTRTTAIVLQTLTDLAPDHPYVSKIGNYLTGVRKGDGRFRNTQEAAFSLMALAEVVATKEKDVPDFTAKVSLGADTLASEPFKGRSMDVKNAYVDIAKIVAGGTDAPLPFDFSKSGPGVLYYSALLRYAPSVMPMDALDRGMVVQRWFEPWQGGGQVTTVHAGDLVRIRVRLGTSQARDWVAVDVPLPAGLEAVDTTLASSGHNATAPHQEANDSYDNESAEDTYAEGRESDDADQDEDGDNGGRQSFSAYAASFWSPFNHVEQRDDRVVLFSDHLPPGVHVASFVARATTPGEFVLKPASAEEMYAPEVFGRSAGGVFKVILAPEVAGN